MFHRGMEFKDENWNQAVCSLLVFSNEERERDSTMAVFQQTTLRYQRASLYIVTAVIIYSVVFSFGRRSTLLYKEMNNLNALSTLPVNLS
jgi:hypothetical protein